MCFSLSLAGVFASGDNQDAAITLQAGRYQEPPEAESLQDRSWLTHLNFAPEPVEAFAAATGRLISDPMRRL